MTLKQFIIFMSICCLSAVADAQTNPSTEPFRVMTWNIWHGGREDGKDVGPKRVVEVIRESKADIVAMQETYGSGELISKELGFHFHPRGTNVSIHSRFPVIEDLSVFEEFKCVGALIELPDKRNVAVYSIWLPYNKEIWEEGTRDSSKPETMIAACQASCEDLIKIKTLIEKRLSADKYADVPIVIAGDFNSMSHLDYVASAQDQYEVAIDWPTSHVMIDDGFRDSWRELHPEVDRTLDRTWTPRFKKQQQDRIDYIYYRGTGLEAGESIVIDSHDQKFPSDHAAVVTRFVWPKQDLNASRLRVATYNIRHGAGTDGKLDLSRTGAVIKNLRADVIGLQEVDCKVRRSKNVDQPEFLAKQTGMNASFGSFMDYDGGQYGMAILSRFPIIRKQEVRLPDGNEPRIALACEIQLPNDQTIMAVNVHFDWVKNDQFRFSQATVLAEYLEQLDTPYILLGDFNDTADSRTVQLLAKNKRHNRQPQMNRSTFPSTDPKTEIDFLLASPLLSWKLAHYTPLDAAKTSDHRPVLAIFDLINAAKGKED
ncbi:MAG: endonuclease/exonuclease/phosphatase family protein [Planctomycetota bacterium]